MAWISLQVVEGRAPFCFRNILKSMDALRIRVEVRDGGQVDYRYYVLDEKGIRRDSSATVARCPECGEEDLVPALQRGSFLECSFCKHVFQGSIDLSDPDEAAYAADDHEEN